MRFNYSAFAVVALLSASAAIASESASSEPSSSSATTAKQAEQPFKLTGTIDVSSAYATVTKPYDNANIQTANAMFNLKDGYRVGFGVSALNAWGDDARVFSLRAVTPITKGVWVDSGVAFSDKARISIRRAVSSTVNWKIPDQPFILGIGAGYTQMRGGGEATTVTAQGVYYVPKVPLVLQGTATYTESHFNTRAGMRYGVAATYGYNKKWQVTTRYSRGRAHYELLSQPGSIADYNSTTVGVTGRYWVTRDWGVTVGASNVKNPYYERNEIKVGAFFSF